MVFDFSFIKSLYSILYLFYKSDELGIKYEQIAEGLFKGDHGLLKIESKGFETKNAAAIYFDGGTALHYFKTQTAFIFAVAKEIYEQKLAKNRLK